MTAHELAAKLNGRQLGAEITPVEEEAASEAGLVVAFGYSCDWTYFRGIMDDEMFTPEGCYFYVKPGQNITMEQHPDAANLKAVWDSGEGYAWTYETELPHATFDILEGSEAFCRGIVFSISDIK